MIVVVLGDSLAYGAWDSEGGWAERLKRYLHRITVESGDAVNNYNVLYNLAVNGETTRNIISRFIFESLPRITLETAIDTSETVVMIIEVGMNDLAITADGKHLVPPDEYEANLAYIFDRAKKFADVVISIGLVPVDESRSTPVPWIPLYYYNKHVSVYDRILRRVSRRFGVNYVKIYDDIDVERHLFDGLHLNDEGHEIIYRKVKEIIDDLLK